MTARPHASLGRILDDLGSTLLDLIYGDPGRPGDVGGVVIHDPVEEPVLAPHAIVLGVGVSEPVDLLLSLGRSDAAALVLRAPVRRSDELAAAAAESGVAVLALARGATWTQLAALLRSMLAEGDVGGAEPETLGGLPSGDLFAVANAIAALIDAPVTIEDRSSRVLAFSGRQDEADPSRVETVLGRQVPERFFRMLTENGVFRQLYTSDEPVYIEPPTDEFADFVVPRVAVGVRAGDEFLGSIWAAVHDKLSTERSQALRDAAKLVALHMLRIRAGADVERRLRSDLLATALEGGAGAREALSRLGLADLPVVVLALATVHTGHSTDAAVMSERQRLTDGLAMHLSAVHPRCAVALIGDVSYGLLPVTRANEEQGVRVATDFLDRVGNRTPAFIGVSPVVTDVSGLADARSSADRAVQVLRSGTTHGSRVARLADVYVEALVLELRDLVAARGGQVTGPVARLAAYDEKHSTNLVETLRAWLDAFGDVIAAAAAVHVHPNTFRYRLRRLTEISGIDLADADHRFVAMLQLRVFPLP
ncbi:PucR family transcriptional regulator [Kibdelosporangium aridum]|uniref:DNA-binding transcriptional regulator, PucR family n=1 Tax=Kibdelosporangium aridum TaxID=2030 RepID=A0A1Y5X265_KIBAR|nr:helix-turn-helix domain-containing protein [Kibdelosporangium aridum]SMC66027.1 DNA-binding transcriptional regulator, PucR family [Kibdelosporangium aridum]